MRAQRATHYRFLIKIERFVRMRSSRIGLSCGLRA